MGEWFDHWMKGGPLKLVSNDRVRYFRMGGGSEGQKHGKVSHGGVWKSAEQWPLETTELSYFLADGGILQTSGNVKEGRRTLVSDPLKPTPTLGGRYGLGNWSPNCSANQTCSTKYLGCDNNEPVNTRPDVLSFVSAALPQEIEITGAAKTTLWVSSDARDTDVFVKLIDVYPDGVALLIAEGQLRMRYRDGLQKPVDMVPGKMYEVQLELGSASNLFARGHRIRIDIQGSNFPHFEPNRNTGIHAGSAARPSVARNSVHFSSSRPSKISLPMVKP
jgi:putative CocE/NonD family hydrolase